MAPLQDTILNPQDENGKFTSLLLLLLIANVNTKCAKNLFSSDELIITLSIVGLKENKYSMMRYHLHVSIIERLFAISMIWIAFKADYWIMSWIAAKKIKLLQNIKGFKP